MISTDYNLYRFSHLVSKDQIILFIHLLKNAVLAPISKKLRTPNTLIALEKIYSILLINKTDYLVTN